MQSLWRASLVTGLAAAIVALLSPTVVHGQEKPDTVKFETADGVTIQGSFYAKAGKADKKTVVMLLHDFDAVHGGGRNFLYADGHVSP